MFVPFSFGFPVNISLGLNIGALLKGSCWDAELVAIPVDTGNRGTAFGTKLFGESFCFGQIKTFDPFFPGKPSDVFWVSNNSRNMGGTSGSSTAQTVAEIKIMNFPE